jgi:putative glutamine amidotransferase
LFEIALLKQALAADKAVMGICRGMQLINIALGGSVYQDLSEDPKKTLKHAQDAPGNLPSHHVTVDEDSRLFNLVGRRPYVNSRHHQALHEIALTLHL